MCRASGCSVVGEHEFCVFHANSRLTLVREAVVKEEENGFKPYMLNIRRALDGKRNKR